MGKEIRMYTLRWEEDNWEQVGGPSLPIQFWDYGNSEMTVKIGSLCNLNSLAPLLSLLQGLP